MTHKKLKPCPFCWNTQPKLLRDADISICYQGHVPVYYAVVCDATKGGCGATGGFAESEEKAADNWNKRAQEAKKMTREEILAAAKKCVCGDREQDYGSPERNFQTIANMWEDYLAAKGHEVVDIAPPDVAAMLALLKIARIASGHAKYDNWIDLAGYAACGGELEGAEA